MCFDLREALIDRLAAREALARRTESTGDQATIAQQQAIHLRRELCEAAVDVGCRCGDFHEQGY